jgi:hypothetical protein
LQNAEKPAAPEPLGRMTHPATPGLALESWASAEQSKYQPVALRFPKCLRESGCPFEATELPPCPASIEALSVAEALQVADRAGRTGADLFVTGTLFAATNMTDLGCAPDTCCNRASGSHQLSDDVSNMSAGTTIFISSGRGRRAFKCSGDDSTVCCDFPSAKVVAFGRVRGQDLIEPRLCRL